MLTIEQIRLALRDRRVSMIASATGLNRQTIERIRDNKVTNPRYKALKALSDYLTGVKNG